MTDPVVRKESSVPTQTRVSIVDLAKLDMFWIREQQVNIKSMSQLVSWSIGVLVDKLEEVGLVKDDISVAEAHNYLKARGLYQDSLLKRSRPRISAAMGFESLRKQGSDPKYHAPMIHNTIHSKHSIDAPPVIARVPENVDVNALIDNVRSKIKADKEFRESNVKEAQQAFKERGMLADDDWLKERQKKEAEVRARENAPIKPGDLKIVDE